MRERQMDVCDVIELLDDHLHPKSSVVLTQISSVHDIAVEGTTIDSEKFPTCLRAARALVRIGVLKEIPAGGMKPITPESRRELKLGMVVNFFREPGFVLAEEPWEAIMKWADGLNI